MTLALESLGLIAGNRSLPLLLARQLRDTGVRRIVAVAFQGETDPQIASIASDVVWIRVGQLSKMIDAFRDRGIRQCVMAGQVAPKNLFDLRPDLRAMKLLFRLKEKNAQTIFSAIADELKAEGIELIEATPWLRPLMPQTGFRLGRSLSQDEKADVRFGFAMAKQVSRLEIGQTVVVRNGTVLAVEGFEGTDRCLARGGELAGNARGAVAVKVAKEKHDLRFDIPCVGPQTIETCIAAGIAVLAFEAGTTLLLEQDRIETLGRNAQMAVTAVDPSSMDSHFE